MTHNDIRTTTNKHTKKFILIVTHTMTHMHTITNTYNDKYTHNDTHSQLKTQ